MGAVVLQPHWKPGPCIPPTESCECPIGQAGEDEASEAEGGLRVDSVVCDESDDEEVEFRGVASGEAVQIRNFSSVDVGGDAQAAVRLLMNGPALDFVGGMRDRPPVQRSNTACRPRRATGYRGSYME